MEFEQKAEEKKMSMSKNIARLAVTAGLTAALSFGGVMAPVTMAFADGAAGSTVTFNDPTYQETTTYKGIQIFTANVSDSTASNIQWAGATETQKNNIQAAVVNAINSWSADNGKGTYESKDAQDAAEWLCANANVDGDNSRVASDSVLNEIAKNLSAAGLIWKTTAQGKNTLDGLDAGYWLFLTASVNNPDEGSAVSQSTDVFTSPIFKLVDGANPVEIAPKKKIPTVEKKILNDRDEKKQGGYTAQNGWSDVADSQVGQLVSYKLIGTIADNYATYDTYTYKFTDTLSQGLTYADGSLEVYALNGQSYTKINPQSYNAVEPAGGNGVLTVNFDKENGLKSATAANAGEELNIGAETKIVVFYKAKLNSKASYAVAGNDNKVYLEYSNNPMVAGTGKSVTKVVTDHVFRLDVTKVDSEDSNKKLKAGFKVKVMDGEGSEDADSQGKWLAQDGTLVEEDKAYEFTTDETSGQIYIPGLDAGKYQITETTTPKGYNTIAPVIITVTPDYDDDGNLTGLNVSDNSGMVDTNNVTNATDATIPVTIRNKKGSNLPLTGLNGVTFTWIAGGAVLCIGVAHLIRSRKQAEESEQE